MWLFPPINKSSKLWSVSSKVILCTVGVSSKIWSEWLNNFEVYNSELLQKLVEERHGRRGMITVSNHHSCLDEPVLWGILNWKYLIRAKYIRWTLAAQDICFTKYWHSLFFSLGRVVPVCRGDGVYQKSMDFMLELLNNGEWVHTFPEGKVNMSKELMRLKWGVGRLIAECRNNPVVLPIWHLGMDSILPNKSPYIPRIGKKVTVMVGEPLTFKKEVDMLRNSGQTARQIRKYITDKIEEEFKELKTKAELFHYERLSRV